MLLLFFYTPLFLCSQTNYNYVEDSSYIIKFDYFDKCGKHFSLFTKQNTVRIIPSLQIPVNHKTISGFISYEYLYRSQLDTPFVQKDFQQHTERLYLKTNILNGLPVTLNLSARQSNSPFIKNRIDFNLKFDLNSIRKQLFDQLQSLSDAQMTLKNKIANVLQKMEIKELKIHALRKLVNEESALESVLKEQAEFINQNNDSVNTTIKQKIHLAAPELNIDSLFPILAIYQKNKKQLLNESSDYLNLLNVKKKLGIELAELSKIENPELRNGIISKEAVQKYSNSTKTKAIQKLLLLNSIKTLELGRCIVDYSDLTARNLMLNGVNAAINPSYYFAVAKGQIFNPYNNVVRNQQGNNNNAFLLRAGKGDIEKKAFVITYFEGSQQKYGYTDSAFNKSKFSGISASYLLKDRERKGIHLELAKSSSLLLGNSKNQKTYELFNPGNLKNLAFAANGFVDFENIHGQLNAAVRMQGAEFQNLNLFNVSSEQSSYKINYNQHLFRQTANIKIGVEKAQYISRVINRNYNADFVFYNAYISIRKSKLPQLEAGYMPAKQVIVNEQNLLEEFAFRNSFATISYMFTLPKLSTGTILSYQNYANVNKGLSNLNMKNISGQQLFFIQNNQYQINFHYQSRMGLKMITYETGAKIELAKSLRISCLGKLNRLNHQDTKLGYDCSLQWNLKKWGVFDLYYIRNFITNFYNQPMDYKMARLSFLKYF